MLDYAEIMSYLELTTEFFPESMLETVRNTSLPLFCANVFCLMDGSVKQQWLKDSLIKDELEAIRKQVKRLAVKTCLIIVDVSIIKCIGKHSSSYAVVQDRLASSLKQFILGVTGNVELAKDQLHKNSNFMAKNGAKFLKRVLEKVNPETKAYHVDLVQSLYEFEERFLSLKDRDFLLQILSSVSKGQLIQVKKVSEAAKVKQAAEKAGPLTLQDKENIKSIVDMFGGTHTKAYVEQVYLMNNKDTEKSLDMFLTGKGLPKSATETELVVEVKQPKEEVIETRVSRDTRAYVLDEFKDILFPRQKNKFEIAHDKAMAIKMQEEEAEQREYRKKILQLAE